MHQAGDIDSEFEFDTEAHRKRYAKWFLHFWLWILFNPDKFHQDFGFFGLISHRTKHDLFLRYSLWNIYVI